MLFLLVEITANALTQCCTLTADCISYFPSLFCFLLSLSVGFVQLFFLAIFMFSHMMWFRLNLNCNCADDRDGGTHRTNTFLPLYYCLQFIYCFFFSRWIRMRQTFPLTVLRRRRKKLTRKLHNNIIIIFSRFDWFALCAGARLCSVWTSERVRFRLFVLSVVIFRSPCVDIISQMPQCILS